MVGRYGFNLEAAFPPPLTLHVVLQESTWGRTGGFHHFVILAALTQVHARSWTLIDLYSPGMDAENQPQTGSFEKNKERSITKTSRPVYTTTISTSSPWSYRKSGGGGSQLKTAIIAENIYNRFLLNLPKGNPSMGRHHFPSA